MKELRKWIESMESIMVRPAVGWGHERDELPKAMLTQAELYKGFALLFNVLEEINQSLESKVKADE